MLNPRLSGSVHIHIRNKGFLILSSSAQFQLPIISEDKQLNLFQLRDLTGWYWAQPEGRYYIRQVGNQIYWFGENDAVPATWTNVAYSTINGNIVDVNWADVPIGQTMNSGTVELIVNWQNQMSNSTPLLTVQQQTGDFGTIAMHGPWGGRLLKALVALPH